MSEATRTGDRPPSEVTSATGTSQTPPSRQRAQHTVGFGLLIALGGATVVMAVLMLYAPLERETVGILGLVMTVCLMMLGIHVATSMAVPSLLGLWVLGGQRSVEFALETIPHNSAASWTLSVVPMFILMGIVVYEVGLATVLFDAAKQWLGWIPGGLAVASIFAGAGMSAASGSTLGVTYATSRMGIPEMLRAGYAPSFATGTVAMAGVLKMLIPPSITVVIYAGLAETPVGPQLMAGVVPGLTLAVLFAVSIVIRTRLNPSLAPAIDTSAYTGRSRLVSLVRTWPALLIVAIVMGGLYSGLATATESGALAALAAILVGAWAQRARGAKAYGALLARAVGQTVAAVAAVMFLIMAVYMMTLFIALSGVVQEFSQWITELGLGRTAFLLILVVMYVFLGMFMDELAMMLLTVPILIPILNSFDVNLIWFGVFLILLCEVGMVVPPVGFLSFVVHGIAQKPEVNLGISISLIDVFRGVFWYVVVALGLIIFLIFVPEYALWLPNSMTN